MGARRFVRIREPGMQWQGAGSNAILKALDPGVYRLVSLSWTTSNEQPPQSALWYCGIGSAVYDSGEEQSDTREVWRAPFWAAGRVGTFYPDRDFIVDTDEPNFRVHALHGPSPGGAGTADVRVLLERIGDLAMAHELVSGDQKEAAV